MAERRALKILIADDHPMFRLALRYALAEREKDACIAEVASQAALEARVTREEFDLVLLDLAMPGANGFSSLVYLRCERPELSVIVISSYEDPRTARRAQQFGASAFVPKSAPGEAIGEAIEAVLKGGSWFPAHRAALDVTDAQLSQRFASLTPQQLRVLLRLGEGLLNKQIADELCLSENTVKIHVSAILKKLQCLTRTQAAVLIRGLSVDQSDTPFQIRDEDAG
jgi:DNA-binding NarL/FixJ family response regulator